MKRFCILWLAALLLTVGSAFAEITSIEQLNRDGISVGTELGCAADMLIREDLPNAQLQHYNDKQMGYVDVANGRLDAFIFDRLQMERAIKNGLKGVHLLDEDLGEVVQVAVGISPVSSIPDLKDRVNEFIASLWADGTLYDMVTRWVVEGKDDLPKIDQPENAALHLKVGTSGIVQPYSYYVGTELRGFDIELAYRFAAWLGADLEFKVYDYGAIVPAAVSGDIDCIMAKLNVTAERAEVLPFSDPLYEFRVAAMVQGEASVQDEASAQLPAATYEHIGVQTGTSFDATIEKKLPNAKVEYYNTKADLVAALTGHKIDAFVVDEPVAQLLMREDSRLTYLPDFLDTLQFALVFPRTGAGEALRDQFNTFLASLPGDALDELKAKWFADNEDAKTMPDIASFSAENGTLTLATESGYAPFEYVRDGAVVGYDMDLAAQFCESCGYGLNIVDMNFDGILPAIQTGKCDFAAAGIAETPERSESVLFSEPNYTGGTVMVVLNQDTNTGEIESAVGEQAEDQSFMKGISESFNKTFTREDRWKLFAMGVLNTLIITILSMFFGTALGFAVFMLCRNGNPAANLVTRFCLWLVQGMPMVVLLMILYYVIFGSVSISGIVVAVIGFTLTFGSAVFGLLKMGVGAVDVGQYEAAYALGYSNRRTFYKIILPQAIPHILPAFQGEIVGLIKATAVVGYIAVQDLTKMGDIVRSRTYEAFFPLIAVTIIYFVLEGLIKFIISRMSVNFNPKRRKPADILKEVKTDD